MTKESEVEPDDSRIKSRSGLLPVEQEAGSDNPAEEARIILEDSDERVADPEGTKERSAQTPD